MIEKHIPKKWRNVKGIHIKSPTSAALPIWLADELWVEEGDVLDKEQVEVLKEANVGKKRKARALIDTTVVEEVKAIEGVKEKKDKKRKLIESNDDKLDEEIKARKESLKRQKREAEKSVGDEVPKSIKKGKKSKKTVLEV
jgi:ribosome biogenesis protein UTP30